MVDFGPFVSYMINIAGIVPIAHKAYDTGEISDFDNEKYHNVRVHFAKLTLVKRLPEYG